MPSRNTRKRASRGKSAPAASHKKSPTHISEKIDAHLAMINDQIAELRRMLESARNQKRPAEEIPGNTKGKLPEE
jgi:hypothetical protein